MELIQRYLQEVKFWLPKGQKQDILAEIEVDLRAEIADRQEELGRPLVEADYVEILRRRGSPLMVANRFQPQRSLIGPALFPIYWFVLKVVTLCYLVPWLAVGLVLVATLPRFHLSEILGGFWTAAFSTIGLVTLVFAILERTEARKQLLETWDPLKLPKPRPPKSHIPRSSSVFEIVVTVLFGIGWIWYLSSPVLVDRPGLRIALNQGWQMFFWAYLALGVGNLALAIANLRNPYWTPRRATLRMLSNLAGSALFCWITKIGIVALIVTSTLPPEKARALADSINYWIARGLPLAVLIGLLVLASDLRRIYLAMHPEEGSPQGGAESLTGVHPAG